MPLERSLRAAPLLCLVVLAGIFCSPPHFSVAQSTSELTNPQIVATERDVIVEELVRVLDELTAEKEAGGFEARKEYYKALIDFYHFQGDLRNHTKNVLQWQLIASYIILALVTTVTGLGGVLAYKEVMKALTIGLTPEHRLDLAANRFQVTSAITGVIILVLSLFFLLLFVERVFQVNPVRMSDGDSLISGGGQTESVEPEAEASGGAGGNDENGDEGESTNANGQPAG